ncbi:MAG: PTS sugar transporter subunit IIA [Candidatus Zixiibacteriota bacterium]
MQEAEETESEVPVMLIKTMVIDQLVDMLDTTGVVRNKSKLGKLMSNREKRMSTGLQNGIAFPHVRTDVVRGFGMAILIPDIPIPYESFDGEPVSIIIGMVSPTYDDSLHLKMCAKIASLFEFEDFREALKNSKTYDEVVFLFRQEE